MWICYFNNLLYVAMYCCVNAKICLVCHFCHYFAVVHPLRKRQKLTWNVDGLLSLITAQWKYLALLSVKMSLKLEAESNWEMTHALPLSTYGQELYESTVNGHLFTIQEIKQSNRLRYWRIEAKDENTFFFLNL